MFQTRGGENPKMRCQGSIPGWPTAFAARKPSQVDVLEMACFHVLLVFTS